MNLKPVLGGLMVVFLAAGCGGSPKSQETAKVSLPENKAAAVMDSVKKEALDTAGGVKEKAAEIASTVRETVEEKTADLKAVAEEKKEDLKETVDEVSVGVEATVDALKSETEKAIASMVSGVQTAVSNAPATVADAPAVTENEFVVYTDKNANENHFAPSGWMGDYGDIKLDEQFAVNPHSGTTCLQFAYAAKKSQGAGWAGVFWQNPPNNWGTKKGGFDLSKMTKISFWARGEKGGEILQKFMVGGIKGTYTDTAVVELGPVELTADWKEYTINLAGKDLSYISGGFGWATNADLNPQGCTFYLDDIKFAVDASLKPEGKKKQDMPFYVYTDRGSVKNHYIPSGWMGDYGDLKIDAASAESPKEGASCAKITYTNNATQGARWAGMFWQNPANNWGTVPDAGFDLSQAVKVTFWARGEKGGEQISEFKIGGIMGEYADSDSAVIGPVTLTKEWTQYTIDLAGKDLSGIIGGFCWASNLDVNPEGAVFYLDEIRYE